MSSTNLYAKLGRWRVVGVGIGLLAVALSGCGGAGSVLVPTAEPVTITFAYEGINEQQYAGLIQQFEEQNPDVKVELQPWNWRPGAGGYVGPDYSADVNVVYSGAPQSSMMILDPFLGYDDTLDRNDFYPGALDLFTVEGAVWAIPTGLDFGVIYYDKGLFDQKEVAYPTLGWTRDGFLEAAVVLSDPDVGVFGYGVNRPSLNYTLNDAVWFIYAHGGSLTDNLLAPTTVTFNDPLAVEALDWYADLIYEYHVAPTPEEARSLGFPSAGRPMGPVDVGFTTGKVGMLPGRFSERGGITYYTGEWLRPWGVTIVPRDARPATLTWGEGVGISVDAENPEACWRLVVFLSRQNLPRLAPARRSLVESADFEQAVGADAAAVARAALENVLPVYYTAFEANPIFVEAYRSVVNGEATAQAALDQAQQTAEEQAAE